MRGGIYPDDNLFRLRDVGGADVGRNNAPGVRNCTPWVSWDPRIYSYGQLTPRPAPMSPSQSEISRWGGLPRNTERYRPGGSLFRPRGVVVDYICNN